jgi:hypothetical protein
MNNETMTPTEAMATIERLKLSLSYSADHGDWCVMTPHPESEIGIGATAIAAVEAVLVKMGRRTIEARLTKPLAEMGEKMKAAEKSWLTN